MHLLKRFFQALKDAFGPKPPGNFYLEANTLRTLRRIAKQERRTPEEVAGQVLDEALRDIQDQEGNRRCWNSLTPREKEVAALVCLGYTKRQISVKLFISYETVKTHTQHILEKFEEPTCNDLRVRLGEWDFSQWEQ